MAAKRDKRLTSDTAIARTMTPPDAIPGYRLERAVGRGGMGEVHEAVQLSLGRTVAVKLLRQELASDAQFVGRFEKEGAALAALSHPNIVSIVDRGRAAKTYYLVMEFVDGPSLRERMREPDFDVARTLSTMLQVTRAIEYAHHRGVIHRDLKPENILFDEQAGDIAKVTDFGLAGFDERHVDTPRHLTKTHMAMGTASYMAPEQAIDAKSVGPKADLYSLGVMLYELLTGELPIGTFAMPSAKKPGLDPRVDAIIARCLRPSPDDRYPSATELLAELELVTPYVSAPQPVPRRPAGFRRAAVRLRMASAHVWRWASGAALLVLVALGAALLLRPRAPDGGPVGAELAKELAPRGTVTAAGRVDVSARSVVMGEGSDSVSLRAAGRKPRLEKGALVFDFDEAARAGRAALESELAGAGVEVSVVAQVEDRAPSFVEAHLSWLFGERRPNARAALLLLGDAGRSVALVLSPDGQGPALEWALGADRAGVQRAVWPTAPHGGRLTLRIDPEVGLLFALVGEGPSARIVGEGLWLGPDWRQAFGSGARAGVGCLSGKCTFNGLSTVGVELASGLSPPPLPEEEGPAVVEEPASPAQRLQEAPSRPGRASGGKSVGSKAGGSASGSRQPSKAGGTRKSEKGKHR